MAIGPEKTHDLRAVPGMSANMLADYMAASEQSKRSILTRCKYRPRARVVQHDDAKESISRLLASEDFDEESLRTRAEILRNGLQGSQFDNEVAEHNADYIERFLERRPELPRTAQTITRAGRMTALDIEGFRLSFSPDLVFGRVNRRNVPKMGVGFFRYGKGKELDEATACWQGAISMGYLQAKLEQGQADVDPERELCVTLDMWTGIAYPAPTNAVYRFNEVRAVCTGITQRWGAIPAPEGAVF